LELRVYYWVAGVAHFSKYGESIKFFGGMKMDQLENVTIVKKPNVYYNGNVTSRTVFLEDGARKTLGISFARPV
jgi:Protein of unknown function (DUF1255).